MSLAPPFLYARLGYKVGAGGRILIRLRQSCHKRIEGGKLGDR